MAERFGYTNQLSRLHMAYVGSAAITRLSEKSDGTGQQFEVIGQNCPSLNSSAAGSNRRVAVESFGICRSIRIE